MNRSSKSDRPVPFYPTDLPVPYRVRVATASQELRALVVPFSPPFSFCEPAPSDYRPGEVPPGLDSETRLKVA
jgi:hypothetical protein